MRSIRTPHGCPEDVWADVVDRVGDLVVVEFRTVREGGALTVKGSMVEATIKAVRAVIREHIDGLRGAEWEGPDPDAWKQ